MSYDLKSHVGASDEDNLFCQWCEEEAEELVTKYVGTVEVPDAILSLAIVEVGSEIYHRRSAPNGIAQFAAFDGSIIRVARDPMVAAYAILKPYLPLGFA